MMKAIRDRVIVQPGGTIEIHHPELPAGTTAEVIVMVDEVGLAPPSLTSLIGSGKGCFTKASEVDAWLRAERDAWEP